MKYRLTDVTKVVNCVTLYQIEALKDFGDVKAGEKGGWVANENILSQEDECWIYKDALAFGGVVSGGVVISGVVCGGVVSGGVVCGGVVSGGEVCGNAWVCGGVVEDGIHQTSPILIFGSRYFVGWSGVNGHIRSGCILKPIAWWDENLVRCAEEHGYTKNQIEEYKIIFECVKQWMKLNRVDKEEENKKQ